MADRETAPAPRLGTKLLYGLGSVAFGTKDAGFATFLLIYYNQVLGVPATLVSLAMTIAILADAVFDPIIGEISDNWRSSLGRRHPFMYGAAIPVALMFFLLWNPPHLSTGALFAYLVVVAILTRMAIATYEIPSSALAPELSPDYDQRTSLMAFRWMFSAVGAALTLAVTFTFFMAATKDYPVGILNPHGYFGYSIMAGLVMVGAILVSSFGTHARIKYMKQIPVARHRPTLRQLAREMYESLSHRSLLMITLAGLFGGMAGGMGSVLNTYFGTYFWRFTAQQLAVIGLAALLAAIIAVPLAPLVSRNFDKRRGYVITAFASLFVNNITMVLKLFGLLPPDGSSALLLIFFASITVGLALAITSGILVTSMIADIVEDSELRTGRRSEGLFSASLSFVNKATSGMGILLAGTLIDLVHFPKHATPATIDIVAPGAVRNLVLIYMPVQITLWFIAILMVSGYRIDRKTHESNLERLAQSAALADVAPSGAPMGATEAAPSETFEIPRSAEPVAGE
ncbi:MAG: MFS transporter [Alphaproteobacteria bacterium]|nr:MFS transporter [Alphaproteobacteria bacterium]MBV9420585.1 MFS transporter [Alphaproteobacteria bacterium]MBV9541817.1 MFS transporter [Alphaproteobacteria bacterium]MBV9905864.1 MFS transporter [Alphaproteobacteria bacterium]